MTREPMRDVSHTPPHGEHHSNGIWHRGDEAAPASEDADEGVDADGATVDVDPEVADE